jgi:hypothetical protein
MRDLPTKVFAALREHCVTGMIILGGMAELLCIISVHCHHTGLTEQDLADMGIAPSLLRKSVLLAFADLIESKGELGNLHLGFS